MSKKEYTLEKILQYRLDEDMTEYFRYMKKKCADNKEVVDFCDEVLADEKLKAAIKKYLEEQYKRALLAKTSTTVETDVEENKNIGSNILAISKRLIGVVLSLMIYIFSGMMLLGLILLLFSDYIWVCIGVLMFIGMILALVNSIYQDYLQ